MIPAEINNLIGRWFLRLVARYPIIFLAITVGAQCFGIGMVMHGRTRGEIAAGVLCFVFYGGLFVLLIIKLRRGTWVAFCAFGQAVLTPGGPGSFEFMRRTPCPKCGLPMGSNKRGRFTLRQRLCGGWTCPSCNCDIDMQGKMRLSNSGT